jgi:hypothetical protein
VFRLHPASGLRSFWPDLTRSATRPPIPPAPCGDTYSRPWPAPAQSSVAPYSNSRCLSQSQPAGTPSAFHLPRNPSHGGLAPYRQPTAPPQSQTAPPAPPFAIAKGGSPPRLQYSSPPRRPNPRPPHRRLPPPSPSKRGSPRGTVLCPPPPPHSQTARPRHLYRPVQRDGRRTPYSSPPRRPNPRPPRPSYSSPPRRLNHRLPPEAPHSTRPSAAVPRDTVLKPPTPPQSQPAEPAAPYWSGPAGRFPRHRTGGHHAAPIPDLPAVGA